MANILRKWIESDRRELRRIDKIANKVEGYAEEMGKLTDDQLKAKTTECKKRVQEDGEDLDKLLPEAFAVAREGAKRVLGLYPFHVQVMGGIVLHEGNIAEMKTGEGKTLTATMPVYLNALSGKGVHVITVNEYLSQRDAEEMGQLYKWLGCSVGVNGAEKSPDEKREAYQCDIMYSTNSEIGFDYLRDNMAVYQEDQVQRGLNYAIVDEVDSILIDEARTPLIISGPGTGTSKLYQQTDRFVKKLKNEDDYKVDLESKTVSLTDQGIQKAEKYFNLKNLYDPDNTALTHHLDQALRANYIMLKDKDYVVSNGEVLIVDSFTGRVMERIGGERKVIPLFRRPQFRALAGLAACLAICVGIYGLGQGGGRDLPAGGTALLQSDGADLSVQPYMFAPEDEGDVQTRKDGVWTAQAPAPEGDSASVEGAGVAPRAQTAAPEGEAEVILTVSRLPEGARELLGDGVSETYSAETGQETFTLSSLEQLEQIGRAHV